VDHSWRTAVHHESLPPGASASIRAAREANAAAAGLDGFLRQLQALDRRPCQHETLRRLASGGVPILIVHGAEDELVPLSEAQRSLASLGGAPTAEMRVLQRTGHLALVERPHEVAGAIRTWWRKVRTGQRTEAAQMRAATAARTATGASARAFHSPAARNLSSDEAAVCAGSIVVPLSYCARPPSGQQLGLQADRVEDPGLPTFSFMRQHGRWPLAREPQVEPERFSEVAVVPSEQVVHNARAATPPPSLASLGFEVGSC